MVEGKMGFVWVAADPKNRDDGKVPPADTKRAEAKDAKKK